MPHFLQFSVFAVLANPCSVKTLRPPLADSGQPQRTAFGGTFCAVPTEPAQDRSADPSLPQPNGVSQDRLECRAFCYLIAGNRLPPGISPGSKIDEVGGHQIRTSIDAAVAGRVPSDSIVRGGCAVFWGVALILKEIGSKSLVTGEAADRGRRASVELSMG